jgi:phage shock protein A
MGIFTRFRDIVGSNINAMLERAEDPQKLIRMMILEMEDTLIELKVACAGVMAESRKIQRQRQMIEKRIKFWKTKAQLAVQKGRDDLARQALVEKRRFVQRTDLFTSEIAGHNALLEQYRNEISQLDEKLKSARKKKRMLVQRHICASSKKHAREKIRRLDSADTLIKFEDLKARIERMETAAELVDFGRKPGLQDQLQRMSLEEEIERELQALKSPTIEKMEKRVEALETIIDDKAQEDMNHEQI